jgi:hypothetical protein
VRQIAYDHQRQYFVPVFMQMLTQLHSVSGQIPSGRSGHSSCVLPKTNELVVFGGVKNGKWLNSVAILDTNRWRWSTVKVVGNAPRPRSYQRYVCIIRNNDYSAIDNVQTVD